MIATIIIAIVKHTSESISHCLFATIEHEVSADDDTKSRKKSTDCLTVSRQITNSTDCTCAYCGGNLLRETAISRFPPCQVKPYECRVTKGATHQSGSEGSPPLEPRANTFTPRWVRKTEWVMFRKGIRML